jgi:hypothetical protein
MIVEDFSGLQHHNAVSAQFICPVRAGSRPPLHYSNRRQMEKVTLPNLPQDFHTADDQQSV